MHFEDFFVDGPSFPVAVRRYEGDGQELVFVHGGGFNLSAWDAVIASLRAGYQVTTFDLPGHGLSGLGIDGWSHDDAVASLRTVVDAVGYESPLIIGHSLGGMIATHAVAQGLHCRGLVNVDGWTGEPIPARVTDEQAVAATTAMAAMGRMPLDAFEQVVTLQCAQAAQAGLDAAMLEAVLRRQFAITDDVAIARPNSDQQLAMLRSAAGISMGRDLEQITAPVLIVLSSEPDPLPGIDVDLHAQLRGREDVAARFDGHATVQVRWVAAGHNSPILVPDVVARMVDDYAEALPARPRLARSRVHGNSGEF